MKSIKFTDKDLQNYRKENRLMFYVVAYDITNNKRRNQLFKLMKQFGANAQRSVFECDVNTDTFSELMPRIRDIIDIKEDDIKIYYLCNTCLEKIRCLGTGELHVAPDIIII